MTYNKYGIFLTISLLLSIHHGMHATRFINYDKTLQVIARLKALERNPERAEAFRKEFEQKYFRILRPAEYNKLYALIIDLLNTTELRSANQQENVRHVLEMINDELKGLINKHGYRAELIALSHRTSVLCSALSQVPWYDLFGASTVKRDAQDLLAEALLTDMVFEKIQECVNKHMQKTGEKPTEPEHKSQAGKDDTTHE